MSAAPTPIGNPADPTRDGDIAQRGHSSSQPAGAVKAAPALLGRAPAYRGPSPWLDPAKDEKLRALWAEGLSAGAIGRKMRITKNAVIGRVHRLGLPARESPIRYNTPNEAKIAKEMREPRQPPRAQIRHRDPENSLHAIAARKRAAKEVARAFTADAPAPVYDLNFADLPKPNQPPVLPTAGQGIKRGDGCRFPMWPHTDRPDYREQRFCGEPQRDILSSWCKKHCLVIYRQVAA